MARLAKVWAESAFMQGRRPQQEDRHVKILDFTKAARSLQLPIDHLPQPCSFMAIYDGHRGPVCADFVAKNLHLKLLKHLSAKATDIASAMRTACEELDEEFLQRHRTCLDGCTVVLALLTGEELHLAWLGDSRALLSDTEKPHAVCVTQDHRPSVPYEAERVKRAGGMVVKWDGTQRVAKADYEEKMRELRRAKAQGLGTIGQPPVALAVSRAMGDRDFKEAGGGRALLIARPSVNSFRLKRSMRFLVLMCDGITDVLSNDEVVMELNFRREKDPAANARKACGDLVQKAYARGSQDNLTVIMVCFDWEGPEVEEPIGPAAKKQRRD
ncbi:unnamed protein product [Durusdinium trenchii]|uniref:PPM-type phosphatase domain-containing protein n=1 Tax=Durusdinium trenchii TaxID=1381693 RepID=A0ABP0SNA0_9DINO